MNQPHRARKRFGQNFLHDQHVIHRIVEAINPQPGDSLLEIGPGQGALTRPVLQRAGRMHAIEIDRDLAARLPDITREDGELTLIQADALSVDPASLEVPRPIRLFGNLPYNISTPLMFHWLKRAEIVRDMHFMLQKEVVQRIVAGPGSKTYGRLSVWMQYHCQARQLFMVSPGSFNPAPKVDSAVFRLVPHSHPPWPAAPEPILDKLLRTAFAQRRKTLQNNLKGLLDVEALEALGIDPKCRADSLPPEAFGQMSLALTAQGNDS
jgi:16S rRNA (adenine1518-N6/adenine1519-N6)-dimethyltransferase